MKCSDFKEFIHVTEPMVGFNDGKPSVSAKNIEDDAELGTADTFKMGEKYALVISLVIDEHFIANNSTTVSINGTTGYAAGISADGKNVELYGFTIEAKDFRQPHTHTFGEERKTVEPTCVEQGYDCFECLTCGYLEKSNFKPTVEHDWDDGKETTAPTCTEKGKVTRICKVCKTTKVVDGSDPLGHSWDGGKETKPTCTQAGYTVFSCTRCKITKTEEGEGALGHSWDEGVVTAPTCNDGGYTTYTCKTCNATKKEDEKDALGHDWDAWFVVELEEGKSIHKRMCARCKAEEMGDHYFTQWGTEKVHGFFEDGLSERHCVICNHRETKVIYSTVNRVLYSAEGFGVFLLAVALSPINWILKWANPALYEKITAILSPGK